MYIKFIQNNVPIYFYRKEHNGDFLTLKCLNEGKTEEQKEVQ